MSPGGGGGYSDIFIHTLALTIFRVQTFEVQYFLGIQKKMYHLGIKILRIICGGHRKI